MVEIAWMDNQALARMQEVMRKGTETYGEGAWATLPLQEHLNHAVAHLQAYSLNDTSEDHLAHAACRLMGALQRQIADGEPIGSDGDPSGIREDPNRSEAPGQINAGG